MSVPSGMYWRNNLSVFFVATALPAAIRITEVDANAGVRCQFAVTTHLSALVICHRLAQRRGNSVEGRRKACPCRRSARVRHARQYHQAGGAFYQRPDRRMIEGALDQIGFSVAGNQSVGDFRRANVQVLHLGDAATPVCAT
jgi:hypothetical protein